MVTYHGSQSAIVESTTIEVDNGIELLKGGVICLSKINIVNVLSSSSHVFSKMEKNVGNKIGG